MLKKGPSRNAPEPSASSATIGPVRAEGKIVSIGKRVAFAEARITDEAGRLYASATSTLLVFERKS